MSSQSSQVTRGSIFQARTASTVNVCGILKLRLLILHNNDDEWTLELSVSRRSSVPTEWSQLKVSQAGGKRMEVLLETTEG